MPPQAKVAIKAVSAVRRAGNRVHARRGGGGALGAEPKRLTWAVALPIIAVAFVFWALEAFFEWFGFTGPAVLGTAVGAWLSNYLGSFIGGLVGAGLAAVTALTAGEVLEAIGIALAEPIAFFGWLIVGLMLLMTDRRLFKEDPRAILWFTLALTCAEIPIVGTLPSILGATYYLLSAQIKRERAAHQAWQARVRAAQAAEQAEVAAQITEQRQIREQQLFNELASQQALAEARAQEVEQDRDPESPQDALAYA